MNFQKVALVLFVFFSILNTIFFITGNSRGQAESGKELPNCIDDVLDVDNEEFIEPNNDKKIHSNIHPNQFLSYILNATGDTPLPFKILHVLSHTHWDREWYLSFEIFRRNLVALVQDVLALTGAELDIIGPTRRKYPGEDLWHFHMDGQMAPIVDYLEIYPWHKEIIAKASQNDLISLGPWFVQPDEYLVSGEALIRNLMLGIRTAQEIGGKPSLVGYLPDSFGHISQLPQLYDGVGIRFIMFGRGLNIPNIKSELYWRSPDNTTLLAIYVGQYCSGGGTPNPRSSPSDPEPVMTDAIKKWWKDRKQNLEKRATTPHLLVMNGCDHTPMDPFILQNLFLLQNNSNLYQQLQKNFRENNPRIVLDDEKSLVEGGNHNDILPDTIAVQTNPRDYALLVDKEVKIRNISLYVRDGEMRDDVQHLSNTLSTKIRQKFANWQAQTLLERFAEPFQALQWKLFKEHAYEQQLLRYSWKILLQNHAHDSIAGCSSPQVHQEVDTRFAKSSQVSGQLATEAIIELMKHIDFYENFQQISGENSSETAFITVFNTLNIPRSEMVVALADFPFLKKSSVSFEVYRFSKDSKKIMQVPSHMLGQIDYVWDYMIPKYGFRKPYNAYRAQVAFLAEVEPFGYGVYMIRASEGDQHHDVTNTPNATETILENEHLKVILDHKTGRINVADKATNTTFEQINGIELQHESGDEYLSDASGDTKEAILIKILMEDYNQLYSLVKGEYLIDTSIGQVPFSMSFLLSKGSKQLQVRIEMENKWSKIRLRAVFPTSFQTKATRVFAEGQFDIVERIATKDEYHPNQRLIDLFDSVTKQGLGISTRALHEYQIIHDSTTTLCITLLRAVEEIGDWGTFPSSSGRELGLHSFEYAIIPHHGEPVNNIKSWPVLSEAMKFNVPLVAAQMKDYPGRTVSNPLVDLTASELKLASLSHAGEVTASVKRGGGNEKLVIPVIHKNISSLGTLLPPESSFLHLEPSQLVISAFKRAEDRESLIVRFWNPYHVNQKATLKSPLFHIEDAYLCNLNEARIKPLAVKLDEISLDVGPMKIVTVEIV